MRSTLHMLVVGLVLPAFVWATDSFELPPAAEKTIDFERDIAPIIASRCLRCHGAEKVESNYRIDSRAEAIEGGVNGAAIVPGDSANSLLVLLVAGAPGYVPMPNEGERLSAAEVGLVRAWIDQGVAWRDAEAGAAAFSAEALAGDWRMAVAGAGDVSPDWSVAPVAGPEGQPVVSVGADAPAAEGLSHVLWRTDPRPIGAPFVVSIKGDTAVEGPCGGVVFRLVDPYNYHVVSYDAGKGQLSVARVKWGVYGELFRTQAPAPVDGWLRLSVKDLGGTVTVNAGDKEVFDRVVRSIGEESGEAVGVWAPSGSGAAFGIVGGE